jgi:lysozyme family protein
MTLAAVANKPAKEIVEEMHKIRQDFYESLSTFETFGRGWARRNDETKHQALEMI